MADKKVTVTAVIKAKEGKEDIVKQELMSLVGSTQKEAGCINYDLHQAADNQRVFLFYENWKSREDLDKHLEMPYLKAWREKAKDLLVEPPEVTIWKMVS